MAVPVILAVLGISLVLLVLIFLVTPVKVELRLTFTGTVLRARLALLPLGPVAKRIDFIGRRRTLTDLSEDLSRFQTLVRDAFEAKRTFRTSSRLRRRIQFFCFLLTGARCPDPDDLLSLPKTTGLLVGFVRRWIRRLEKFEWKTIVGTGSASSTALAAGTVWNIKSLLISYFIKSGYNGRMPAVTVVPDFQRTRFATDLLCILTVRPGYITFIGMRNLIEGLVVRRSEES